MKQFLIISVSIIILIPGHLCAQVLDETSCKAIFLSNNVEVKVCAAASNKDQFYYLPATLQLSLLNDVPQISLLVYKDKMGGTISGGILHLLFQWGLTRLQEKELQTKIADNIDSAGVLMGAASISFEKDKGLKFLPSGEMLAGIFESALSQPLKISPDETGKSAGSFRLSAKDATIIWNYLNQPGSVKPITLACGYTYTIATREGLIVTAIKKPGTVKGSIKDWMQLAKRYNNTKMIPL